MARFQSPQLAAQKTARKADEQRREKRRSWLILVGVVILMVGSVLAYLLYLLPFLQARRKRPHEPGKKTGTPP